MASDISPVDAEHPGSTKNGESPGHTQRIPDNIQLAAADLFPANGDLGHWYASAFGEHEHLDVKNPALAVHVRDDIW